MNSRLQLTTLMIIAAAVVMGTSPSWAPAATTRVDLHEHDSLDIGCPGQWYDEDDIVVFASVVDCTITTDTGYTSGVPFDIDVVMVDGKAVEVNTANAFLVMQAAAAEDGVGLGIVSGFRSYAEQEYLYGCYINCNCNNCNLAARPGYSNHNSGHALDLNASSPGVYDWLAANGAQYGFERTVPSENWHWEWWGGGPGGGECGPEALGCPEVPEDGRIIEETDACFYGGGQRQYLRDVEEGHGGGLLWTKATDSESASNYALWKLNFSTAGRYEVFAYTDNGEYGQSQQAAYVVDYATGEETVLIDQSSQDGWLSLGVFEFSEEFEHSVRLNDNTGEPWADDPGGVRLMFDALKLVPEGADGGGDDGVDVDEEDERSRDLEDQGGLVGGCSTTGRGHGNLVMWFAIIALLALGRRRQYRGQASVARN